MGCSQSIPEDHPTMFKAKNMDDNEKTKNTVILEVKSQKLIVHSKQKKMMASWPIACLHRYGFNEDMIMIETGHGCDTGQGLFLFKCYRANQIFDKLKTVWGEIQEQHSRSLSIAYPRQMSVMTTQTTVATSNVPYYNTTNSGTNGIPLTANSLLPPGVTSLASTSHHPSTSTSRYTPPTPGTRGSASSHNTGISGAMLDSSQRSIPQHFELQPAPAGRQEMLHRRRINSTINSVSYNRTNETISVNHARHHTVSSDAVEYENSSVIAEFQKIKNKYSPLTEGVTYNTENKRVSLHNSPEMTPRGISANSLRSDCEHVPLTPGSNSTSGIGSLNGNSTTSEGRCNGGTSQLMSTSSTTAPLLPSDPWMLQNCRKHAKKKNRPRMLRHHECLNLSPSLPLSARDYVNTANASMDVSGTPLPATAAVGNGIHFNFDFVSTRFNNMATSTGSSGLQPLPFNNHNVNYVPIEVSTKNGDFYSCGASSASSGLGPGTPLTPRTPGGHHNTEYAEIDLSKTRALSNAFRSRQRERKSRHVSSETSGLINGI